MAGIDKRLTDLTEKVTVPDNAWIHFVDPSDISQNSSGSSYKAKKSAFLSPNLMISNNYNAATNTPTLSDGTGLVGQWARVLTGGSHDFGSGAITLAANDIIAHDGTKWFLFANNNQSVDISGKLDKVSSIGQERVYIINPDGSQGTKNTADIGTLFLSDVTRHAHTGTTAYTRLSTITIPANFIPEGSVWAVEVAASRGSSGAASAATFYVTFPGSVEGADFIRNVNIGTGTNFTSHLVRHVIFRGGNMEMFQNNGNFYHDYQSIQTNTSRAFDRTISNNIYTGITLANSADTAYLDYVIFRRIG